MSEEANGLKSSYKLFVSAVYVSVVLEIIVYSHFNLGSIGNYMTDILRSFTIYQTMIYSKIATIVLAIIASIGATPQKRVDFKVKNMVVIPGLLGLLLIYLSIVTFNISASSLILITYMALSFIGVILVHIAFNNLSKFIQVDLGKDKFNLENESFDQERKKIENEYSVNIPMIYYYKSKWVKGWINIINPFRGTWVIGTPGSGKTFSIIEPVIRQHSAKGFVLCVYDYKFPVLTRKALYHFKKNYEKGVLPKNTGFKIINFSKIEYSHRVNPVQRKYIPNLASALETASTLYEALQKGTKTEGGSGDFFKKSAENFIGSVIYFFVTYDKGQYATMAHVLAFLSKDYQTIFDVLFSNEQLHILLSPFKSAYQNRAFDQLEGQIGTVRVQLSRLATLESFWIFTGDDVDLKITDPKTPNYLIIANDPEMEGINTSLNALILNRLITQINQGEGKNIPCNIIVDELPTLYFYKIDRLIGTARSNKVAVTLGFQEVPQLEGDYGKIGMKKVLSVCSNILCASARSKETLDWLSGSIFGKVKQIKKNVSIDKSKTTISLNEEMGELVPASKIADMPAGFLCGQTARDFVKSTKPGKVDILKSEEFASSKFYSKTFFDMQEIEKENKNLEDPPIIYNFGSEEQKQDLLLKNYRKIVEEVDDLCKHILE